MTRRTAYEHRLTLIIPIAQAVTVATWINTNLAPDTVPTNLGPALSDDGGKTATHRWCSVALPDEFTRVVLNRLCDLASVTKPTAAQWRNRTRAQKRTWLRGVQQNIRDGFGVYVTLSDNEGVWDSPDEALAAMGLSRIEG